jgi:hypothetical protein
MPNQVACIMAILLTCPCGRKLKVKDEFAGQEGQCPACGQTLMIPYPGDEAQPAPPPPPPAVELKPEPESEAQSDQEVRRIPQRAEQRPERLPNHGGDALPLNGDYFVEAPAEIGPLTSANTTLRQGQRPWSIAARIILCVAATLGGLFLGVGLDLIFDFSTFWFFLWLIACPLVAFAIALAVTSFTHTVTYVGEEGVARFVCSGTRTNVTKKEVFLFRDATHLRTSTTHHYNRGSYQYTSYKFTWTDVGGRQRYEISGTHNNKNGVPPSTHAFHYGRGAELAWTMYLLDQAHRQIDLAGGVSFPLKAGKSIRVCPGRIIFNFKDDDPVEWEAEEVGDAVIQKGVVKIKRVDAQEGWFSSTGVIKFPFDELANAQLFFHLMEKLIGIEVR